MIFFPAKQFNSLWLKKTSFSKNYLILFILVFGIIGGYILLSSFAAGAAPAPMPLISRGKPAFASSGTASNANDANPDSHWLASNVATNTPAWLAYDLSSVPTVQRGQIYVTWNNDPITYPYDHVIDGSIAYGSLKDYTIQANPALGGGSAPTSGWVTIATVTNNVYHSRSHLVNMTGNNWIRINVTAPDSVPGDPYIDINMDVHDARLGADDSWLFIGDSITANGMAHEIINSTGTYSELIKAANPNYYPAFDSAGIGATDTDTGVQYINTWLNNFPGKYVVVSYGNTSVLGCGSTTTYYNNYVTIVQAILAAGKIPVVPTLIWQANATAQTCSAQFAAKVQQLWTAFPQIVHGPDLYNIFKNHNEYFSSSDTYIHPNAAGNVVYRQAWRDAMLANVYTASADTTPPVISSVASSSVTASAATITWTTDESSDSQVDYGITTSYGSSTTLNSSLVTSHSQSLSGLTANTTYHYRVKSKDASGNLVTGSDNSFTTIGAIAPMPLISRGKPAFASSGTASNGNDASYDTYWTSTATPAWVAYDLSLVPAAQRKQVYLGWYNDTNTYPYDRTLIGDPPVKNVGAYTIEVNPAAGGTSAPTTGWVTMATVSGNTYHSRSHLFDMTGNNWVRMNVSASDGAGGTGGVSFNMDVHDASQGAQDSWIFYGASIIEGSMHHDSLYGTSDNFSQLINKANPNYFPAEEAGGTSGLFSWQAASNIDKWLSTFPGKYVTLNYGTNDASSCDTDRTYSSYVTMVQAILAAGKTPVVPIIPWGSNANIQSCGPTIVQYIKDLYIAFPQIIKGPDMWTFFSNNQSLIGSDGMHPTQAGDVAYRQQWANTMLANVYTMATPDTIPPVISGVTSGSLTSSGATITWTTNENADSQVEYGTTTSYGTSTTLNTNLVTSHSQALSGLVANTTYHYRVKSKDAAGNLTTGSDNTFTTTASGTGVQGDLNSDAHVNILDLSILLSHYGQSATASQGDINSDGNCNILDLSILLSHYGT